MHGEEGANHCPLWDYAVGKMGKIKNEIKKMLRQRIGRVECYLFYEKVTLKLGLQGKESEGKYSGRWYQVARD